MTEVQARGAHTSQSAEQAARKFLCNLPGAGRAYGAGRIVYESEVAALLTAREADLRARAESAEASVAALRESLCNLMHIDGSPESLDQMRVGIVLNAGTAPDEDAAEAAMRCVEALAATAEAAARRDEAIRAEADAATDEVIALACESVGAPRRKGDPYEVLTVAFEAIRASERERCAKVADDAYEKWKANADRPQSEHSGPSYAAAVAGEAASRDIAAAIRALSPGTADAGEGAK